MPPSPPSEPVDASGDVPSRTTADAPVTNVPITDLPVTDVPVTDGPVTALPVETVELVRGTALPPPVWERPVSSPPAPPEAGTFRSPIPRPPPRPVPVEPRGPAVEPPTQPGPGGRALPRGSVEATPPLRAERTPLAPPPIEEPRFVDLGHDDRLPGLPEPPGADHPPTGRHVAEHRAPQPRIDPGIGGRAVGDPGADPLVTPAARRDAPVATWARGDAGRGGLDGPGRPGGPGGTTERDGPEQEPEGSTAVRLAPRRRLTAALAVVAAVAVVGAILLTIGRRQPATSSAYPWETLPAPVLAQPRRLWTVDLGGSAPDRVAADAGRIFLARVTDPAITISALAASDGHTLWEATVDAPGSSVMQLVLAGDVLVAVTGSNGVRAGVSAFDTATGNRRWQVTVDASWVTVVDGTDPLMVLSGPSPRLATRVDALDLVTGQPRWSRSGVVGDLDGRRLALVENDDVLTVDITDGHETGRWPGVARGMVARTVVVSDSRVVVLSEDDLRLAGVGSSRLDGSLDPGIGQLFTTIRTGGDQVTVLSQDGVAGIDLRTGHIDWSRGVTPRALARTDGRTILLGWSDGATGTMVTIDTRSGREEGTRDIEGLVRRPRDRRSSYIARADFLADGATYQVSGGGVQAYDLPGLQPLWTLEPSDLGSSARDVTATEAGLLVATTTGGLQLYR